jgi:phosphate transport system substrate-binding protein
MSELIREYSNNNVDMQETGSSAGIIAVMENVADIGMSSRELSTEEKESGLMEYVIALDAMVVIVNNNNPINELTKEQLFDIFSGKLTNWAQLGGADDEIYVYSREEGSGTRTAFEEIVGLEEDVLSVDGEKVKRSLISYDAIFEKSTGAIKTAVASTRGAIGYISLASMGSEVKPISIDKVAPYLENLKDNSYLLSRKFILCTLMTVSYQTEAFIDFILSENGREVIENNGYVSLD